jgi:hypothetical protein
MHGRPRRGRRGRRGAGEVVKFSTISMWHCEPNELKPKSILTIKNSGDHQAKRRKDKTN